MKKHNQNIIDDHIPCGDFSKLSNNKSKLSVANKALREKRYNDALVLYNELVSYPAYDLPNSILDYIKKIISQINGSVIKEKDEELNCKNIKPNRIVLLVNPSHAHQIEVNFWTEFAKKLSSQGYEVIDLAFRKSTEFPHTKIVLHPARSHELAGRLADYEELPMPTWVGEELIDLAVDWEHRRWQLEKYTPKSRDGVVRTIKYIDHVINVLRPVLILTTNKIDPPNFFSHIAAKHYNVMYRFLERSPLDTYLLENYGMFGESETVERVITRLINRGNMNYSSTRSQQLIKKIIGNPYGFRAKEANRIPYNTEGTKTRPLFFLPLDNALWTGWAQSDHPQGDIDYKVFRTPENAILSLDKAIKAAGGRFLIKPHPSCKEWLRISKEFNDVEFTEADLDTLCSEADVIITFLTKVCYLGLAKGKAVVSFGCGLLDNLGVTYQVKSAIELPSILNNAMQKKDLNIKLQKFFELLPMLELDFISNGEHLANAFSDLHQISNEVSGQDFLRLFNTAFKRKSKQVSSCIDRQIIDHDLPIVVFDISRLLNRELRMSGISRYIISLAKQLVLDPRISVYLAYVSQINKYGTSAIVFNELQKEFGRKLYPLTDLLNCIESSGKPYVYHSPINPLPEKVKYPNMRRVITVHDLFHITLTHHYAAKKFITPSIIESIDLDNDGIISVSAFSLDQLSSFVGKVLKFSTITHLGVDQNFAKSGIGVEISIINELGWEDSELIVIPFQGDPRKGFERMIKLAQSWVSYASNRRIVVFGQSRNKLNFDSKLCDLDIDTDKVLYLADLTDEQLARLYQRSLFMLYLSEAEGFGLPPLEAMSCGCPAVLLANTALAEVYHGWSLLMSMDISDSELLSKINSLDFKSYQKAAIDFTRQFEWNIVGDKTVDFYLNYI